MKKRMTIMGMGGLLITAVFMHMAVTGAQEPEETPPVAEPNEAVVEPDETTVEGGKSTEKGKLVNLSVSEVSVQDVLRSLASLREGVNLIIDPGVSGTVSLQLDNVPWETALDVITESQGLAYRKEESNLYRIYKPREKVEEDIVIDLYTAGEVKELSDQQVMKLVTEEGLTVEEARGRIESMPGLYVKRVSVDERSALDVVRELAKAAGLNYTFSPRAGRPEPQKEEDEAPPKLEAPRVSLNLRNLSVERALALVAEQGGLEANKEQGVWVISQLTPKQREIEPLKLETFQVEFIPLDNELVAIMKTLLSERGKVSRGKNKILIVKDTKEGIDAVRQTLEVMDTPTPQVLIEARFFQISNSDSLKLGIDWQDLGSDGGAAFGANTKDLIFDYWDSQKAFDDAADEPVINDKDGNSIAQMFDPENAKTAILNLPDFSVVLHALKDSNEAEELANPKIVVSSDEQATIHIGEQRPIIQTDIESTESGGAIVSYELDEDYGGEVVEELMLGPEAEGARQARSYKTNKGYLDLGTKLTVLPSVKTEEEVYIRVVPELMSVIGEAEFPLQGGGGEVINTISFPQLFRTYVRTQFTVKTGQTIAIGGLVSKQKTTNENKVPLLGSIPYLGRAFRYNTDNVTQSETIIFLTVKVLAGKELNVTSAVPIRSRGVQDEVERIEEEDARGAVYDPEYVKQLIKDLEEAEKDTAVQRLKRKLLGTDKDEEAEKTLEAASEIDASETSEEMRGFDDASPEEPAAESPDVEAANDGEEVSGKDDEEGMSGAGVLDEKDENLILEEEDGAEDEELVEELDVTASGG